MESKPHRLLVIGKAGNGKSSVCNILAGREHFTTGRSFSATTRTAKHSDITRRDGLRIRIVDTPDITNTEKSDLQMEREVQRWKDLVTPHPTAVLLTVRCDVRYTPEELVIFRHIQKLWGDNSLKRHLLVAFTFGDCLDNDLEEDLKVVCGELKQVLREAGGRYVVFNKKDPNPDRQVQNLLALLEKSPTSGSDVGLSPEVLIGLAIPLVVFLSSCCWDTVVSCVQSSYDYLCDCYASVGVWVNENLVG